MDVALPAGERGAVGSSMRAPNGSAACIASDASNGRGMAPRRIWVSVHWITRPG